MMRRKRRRSKRLRRAIRRTRMMTGRTTSYRHTQVRCSHGGRCLRGCHERGIGVAATACRCDLTCIRLQEPASKSRYTWGSACRRGRRSTGGGSSLPAYVRSPPLRGVSAVNTFGRGVRRAPKCSDGQGRRLRGRFGRARRLRQRLRPPVPVEQGMPPLLMSIRWRLILVVKGLLSRPLIPALFSHIPPEAEAWHADMRRLGPANQPAPPAMF